MSHSQTSLAKCLVRSKLFIIQCRPRTVTSVRFLRYRSDFADEAFVVDVFDCTPLWNSPPLRIRPQNACPVMLKRYYNRLYCYVLYVNSYAVKVACKRVK